MPTLTLTDLTLSFGSKRILAGLNLTLNKGDRGILMGPSGVGKSTLLKVASGLLTPTEGRVVRATSRFTLLFQKNALFDSMAALENLIFVHQAVEPGASPRDSQKRAEALLERVSLSHAGDVRPSELSGGMKKRLALARALIIEPELLLLDEPTAGLDPITSREITELILELSQGATLLAVTSEAPVALRLGNRFFFLFESGFREHPSPTRSLLKVDPEVSRFFYGGDT